MKVNVRRVARFCALGSAGLLVQDKFDGLSLGDWAVVGWIALGASLLILLLMEDWLRPYRPTMGIEHGPRFASFRFEAPEKRLPGLQPRGNRKKEIEIGERAIRVGGEVLEAVGRAESKAGSLMGLSTHIAQRDRELDEYQRGYQEALKELQAEVGAAWAEILHDLDEVGARPQRAREIQVNFTGLDAEAVAVQAAGRKLMRQNDVEPSA